MTHDTRTVSPGWSAVSWAQRRLSRTIMPTVLPWDLLLLMISLQHSENRIIKTDSIWVQPLECQYIYFWSTPDSWNVPFFILLRVKYRISIRSLPSDTVSVRRHISLYYHIFTFHTRICPLAHFRFKSALASFQFPCRKLFFSFVSSSISISTLHFRFDGVRTAL